VLLNKIPYKIILIFVAVLLLFIICTYFSSLIFLSLLGINSKDFNLLQSIQLGVESWNIPTLRYKWLLSFILPWAAIALVIILALRQNQRHIFGKAHWASYFEAKKAGLLAKKGILLGKKWWRYLCIDGFEHVLVFAPSGSGKTTSLVIPNLLNWDDSIICQDIKLTLFEKTAKYRE
jgi:type IV secretion system protein VirD4